MQSYKFYVRKSLACLSVPKKQIFNNNKNNFKNLNAAPVLGLLRDPDSLISCSGNKKMK